MPSPRIAFSRKSLTNIEPAAKRLTYFDTETRGLTVEVTPSGVKAFRVYRKIEGRPEKITLGRFNPSLPDSREFPQGTDLLKVLLAQPELNVKMARRLAEAVNVQLDAGSNPAETKRKGRGELTLGQMFERFVTDYAIPHKLRTIDTMRQMYERYLGELPDAPVKKHGCKRTKSPVGVNWHNRKLSSITHEDLRKLHMNVGKIRAGSTANQIVDLVSRLYGKARDWSEFSGRAPSEGIEFLPEVKRDRFIKAPEMPAFWTALDEEPSEDFRDFVMLSILCGARSGNTMAMAWADIDLQAAEWRVPDVDSKNGEAMRVVLPPEAVDVLERRLAGATSAWVFPSDSASGHMTMPRKRWQSFLKRAGIANLRFHDLRRSLGSWQARTGASLLIIGKTLGHKSQQATQIYAQLDTDPVHEAVGIATSAMIAAGRGSAEKSSPVSGTKRTV